MRPLLIKMQGFGPFRDETIVDFSDVELVGLVGATGSGKSTILDAITFALFGRIARLDARAVAPVVNALSQEARVSFDFELAGQTYTAVRVVRRLGDGASTKEARLERDGESLAAKKDEVDEQVEQLLGMNFDRFTKVAFLPQGKFSAFLHDKPADRQKLLRTLLGLGLYEELGKQARATKARATAQLEVLRPKLTDAGVTDDQITELEAAAQALLAVQRQLRERLADRAQLVDELARLTKEADDFAILAFAVASVSVPPEVGELGDRIADAGQKVVEAERRLGEANDAYTAATQAVADGPDRAKLTRWLEAHDELDAVATAIASLEAHEANAREALESAQAAVDELAARLAELAEATTQAEGAEAEATAALESSRPITEVENDMRSHHRVVDLDEQVAKRRDTAAEAERQGGRAALGLAAAIDALASAQSELREIETAGHVAVLAESLVAGDQCPVCQQVITQVPHHATAIELEAAKAAAATAEAAVAAARQVDAQASQAAAVSRSSLADAEAERARQIATVEALRSLVQLETELAQRSKVDAAAIDARNECDAARKHERTLRDSDGAKRVAHALTAATADATRLRAKIDAAAARGRDLEQVVATGPGRSEIDAQLATADRLAEVQRQAQQRRDLAGTSLDQARTARNDVRAHEDALRRAFTSVRDRFVGIDPPQPDHESVLADWQAFAAWAKTQRAPLEDHHRHAAALADATTASLATTDGQMHALCENIPQARTVTVAELDPLVTRLHAAAEADAASARRRQQQLAKDRAEVAALEESEEVHELLGHQLRSSGFEQWLLDEVVDGLVARASERLFELSRSEYSIEVDGMVFWVRDHRNGDELRDARTLSGGETFLASLALALALADSIEEMAPDDTPPVECLFLDEGFGTLDPETLDVVASAIEELGASGRMVGVISHIRELAERMPVRFEVTRQSTTSVVAKVFS